MIRWNYKLLLMFSILVATHIGCSSNHDHAHGEEHDEIHKAHDTATAIEVLKIENLLRDSLALAPEAEVIVSYLEVPIETTLPRHYHPGEEFVYMLEGSGELEINAETIVLVAGDLFKVPYKAIHSFSTTDIEAKAVVFRIHEAGQPDRILVE